MDIIEYGQNCILLHNAMTMEEQIELFDVIKKEHASMPAAMQTGNGVSFVVDDAFTQSLPFQIVSKARGFIEDNYQTKGLAKDVSKFKLFCCDALTYQYPDGSLSRHCDGRRDRSVVFLYSLGCTAKFYVHTPEMGGDAYKDGKVLDFQSGDMLFFEATKAASMVHGVDSVDEASTCPPALKRAHAELAQSRVSLQIRAS